MRSVRNESSVVKTNRLYAFIDGFEKDKLYMKLYIIIIYSAYHYQLNIIIVF